MTLSIHAQAVSAALLLIAVIALFPARYGSLARWAAVALGAALLDQGTKALLLARLPGEALYRDYTYLGGWFHIGYFQNDALGFDPTFPFLLLSTLAFVLALAVLYQRLARAGYRLSVPMEGSLGLIAGGLLGILLDRLRLRYVVDFLEFGPDPNYVYNFADLLTIAGGVLAFLRFGELAAAVRRGFARSDPSGDGTVPAARRPARQTVAAVSLCLASAVCLHFLWQVGVVKLPPLHAAAQRGDLRRVARLLKRGAKVNQRDPQGATALLYAASTDSLGVAQLLLDHKADPNVETNRGGTPLWEAGFSPRAEEMTALLLDHGAKPAPMAFQFALLHHSPRLVTLFLKHGADLNSGCGATPPLSVAATAEGNAATLRTLLRAGVAVDGKDRDGATALHRAAHAGDPAMVKALLEAGAEVDARNAQGETPLLAAEEGRVGGLQSMKKTLDTTGGRAVSAVLLAHGADVNAQSKDGWTPLMRASVRGDVAWVKLLLKAGARANVRGAKGWTALHYAAAKGHASVVKTLLTAGADSRAVTDDGRTPAALAREVQVRRVLLRS